MLGLASTDRTSARRAPPARKLARVVQPTATERHFDKNEIIVSKTDLKGHMIYVNRVFMAISDYDESELLGQPHSMIRHPDMPRCVFKLLWERLQSGKEIFAYVKNMTKTGDYYWVHAHVTPTILSSGEIIGYHSNRRVPERRILDETIIPLYRALKAIEDRDPDRKSGLQQSWDKLHAILKEKEISYDEFIFGL
ncbi:MAG TPA: PAS domain-containing protein [Hypericibacter adhaerens]|jgi:PAS domain S-box-containing protein|uniref:Transcriptional regulator n=1 Tax=Hypericibacter adhaerens TaxID=2602016 RepID=A0A5J6N2W3_9PROT|nr:PAS domain-containing protein [Hypericibacter adhaerens]QEX23654.1 transcriptional regulator [Hypericibacter adhaerens]HWA44450.1 PAS domain-containing protein [Hypericibacter adhaerens]